MIIAPKKQDFDMAPVKVLVAQLSLEKSSLNCECVRTVSGAPGSTPASRRDTKGGGGGMYGNERLPAHGQAQRTVGIRL